jgi:hypothetical protein
MVYRTNGTLLLKLSFVRDRVYVTLEVGLLSFPTPLTTISLPFIDAMPQSKGIQFNFQSMIKQTHPHQHPKKHPQKHQLKQKRRSRTFFPESAKEEFKEVHY